jgi:hypothetical protein
MTRFAWLVLLAGCTLYFHDNPKKDICSPEPQPTTYQRLDPSTLDCETFTDYSQVCQQCGFCPPGPGGDPGVGWPDCASDCTSLDEAQCGADSRCRITRDWARYYTNQPDSFLQCAPLDTDTDHTDPTVCAGRDAESCARNPGCTALYQELLTDCANCAPAFAYQECIPVAQKAGTCGGAVACAEAIMCPAGTTPGVDGLCYTGACIPDQFCPQP